MSMPKPPDPARTIEYRRSPDYRPREGLDFRMVDIMSDGVRLQGQVFTPQGVPPGTRLPAVVMAHGWGGVGAFMRADASEVARAGYFVLVFDYRGWGESDSRLVLDGTPEPSHLSGEAEPFTARVRPLREYIDPTEQAGDWQSAIDWLMGEPGVDPKRIGIRGSSYSGGHVIHVAAKDPRVKAVVSQVGGMDSRFAVDPDQDPATSQQTRMARGEIGYPEPRASAIMGLIGTPIERKMSTYAPVEDAVNVTAPTLILLVEHEEYCDNAEHGGLAYERAKGPKELHVYPGVSHYAIYRPEEEGGVRSDVIARTIAWFDKHLKP